jgi:hypothetical protein
MTILGQYANASLDLEISKKMPAGTNFWHRTGFEVARPGGR